MALYHKNACVPLFDPEIEPYQVLPLIVRVGLEAMAMMDTSHSPNLQGWSLAIRWLHVISRTLVEDVIPCIEMPSEYSTAPADWAELNDRNNKYVHIVSFSL